MSGSGDTVPHLCWDCRKAEDQSCLVYNELTAIVEDNFDQIEIRFQVPNCQFFEKDDILSQEGSVVHRRTVL